MNHLDLNSLLLLSLNLLAGVAAYQFSGLEKKLEKEAAKLWKFAGQTRAKLDSHCENFELHKA